MKSETNRIEYKQELTDDLEKEVIAFLNYPEGGLIYLGIQNFLLKKIDRHWILCIMIIMIIMTWSWIL